MKKWTLDQVRKFHWPVAMAGYTYPPITPAPFPGKYPTRIGLELRHYRTGKVLFEYLGKPCVLAVREFTDRAMKEVCSGYAVEFDRKNLVASRTFMTPLLGPSLGATAAEGIRTLRHYYHPFHPDGDNRVVVNYFYNPFYVLEIALRVKPEDTDRVIVRMYSPTKTTPSMSKHRAWLREFVFAAERQPDVAQARQPLLQYRVTWGGGTRIEAVPTTAQVFAVDPMQTTPFTTGLGGLGAAVGVQTAPTPLPEQEPPRNRTIDDIWRETANAFITRTEP